MRSLLLGAGNDRRRKVSWEGHTEFGELTTLDIDPGTGCDVVHDLNVLPYPFEDESFDEIHAYEVLEHCGRQGDWKYFFDQFAEFYRILKPDGFLVATVPMWDSPWAWGDPGHTRCIPKESLYLLSQALYEAEVGKTALTDYRPFYKGDFELLAVNEGEHQLGFLLKAIK